MFATIIVSMLCLYALCFGAMFWLISTRLQGNKLGMDVFGAGNAMLGVAYGLQLLGGEPDWDLLSVVNHTLTLCVPITYWIGGMRYFGREASVVKPLVLTAVGYTVAQILCQWALGSVARYAMMSLVSGVMFFVMTGAVVYARLTVAKHLGLEMALFGVGIAGLCVMNFVKFEMVATEGLSALSMDDTFQVVFYLYMSFLATVLAPSMIWLVLHRLTDELRAAAALDPLTRLLNRRGLMAGLDEHFRLRTAGPARLVMLDIDHFKRINDTYGHKAGDSVLCHIADVLRHTLRRGDLISRTGGEEFVVVCFDTSDEGVQRLAERVCHLIADAVVQVPGARRGMCCTVTIGISLPFTSAESFDTAMQEADAALYRGKASGRNRIEWGHKGVHAPVPAPVFTPV